MKDLIQIQTDDNGIRTVDARDLHRFVESKRSFTEWIQTRIQNYGFVKDLDFIVFHADAVNPGTKGLGGRPSKEYHLSIDMAKELSMLEGNDKGKQARQYFIAKEKQAYQQALIITSLKNEIIGEIKTEFKKLTDDFVKSELTALDVRKADEVVIDMGYDKISHGEKCVVISAIRNKAKINGEHIPERYANLRSNIFLAYGVSRFVQIRKADVKRILGDISCYDFKNQQLSIHSHLKLAK